MRAAGSARRSGSSSTASHSAAALTRRWHASITFATEAIGTVPVSRIVSELARSVMQGPLPAMLPHGVETPMNKLLVASLIVACGGNEPTPRAVMPTPPTTIAAAPAAEPPPATPPPTVAARPRQDLIPRAVLYGNPERANVQISPDGKHLSWLAPKDGVLNIWVAPIGKLDEARAVTAEAKQRIRQYWWAFTNKHVLYLQDTAGDENHHLFRAGIADGKITDLTPHKGARVQLERLSERVPTTVLVSSNDRDPKVFDLYRVDLLTGRRTMAARNDDRFLRFTSDRDLNARFAEKKLPDGSVQLLASRRAAGKVTWAAFDTIPFEDGETTSVIGLSPDGAALYMNDSRGRDTAALVAIDVATKKQTVLAEDAHADAGDVIVHPTKHHVQAVAFEYIKRAWTVIDK